MSKIAIYIDSSEYADYLDQGDRIAEEYRSPLADAKEIRRLLRDEQGRLLKPVHSDPGPPNPNSTLLMVFRVIPATERCDDDVKWLFRRFKIWRSRAGPLPIGIFRTRVTNPFVRGFDGVLGNHPVKKFAEIDCSVPFGDDRGKRLRKHSFLQFYDGFDSKDWAVGDVSAPVWYLRLVHLLLQKYLASKDSKWGASYPETPAKIVVCFDDSVRDTYKQFEKFVGKEELSSENFRQPASIIEDIGVLSREKNENKFDALVIVSKETRFEGIRTAIEASDLAVNQAGAGGVKISSGTHRGVSRGPKFIQYVRIDDTAREIRYLPNAFKCPDNLFVIWDFIWEAMLRTNQGRNPK